MEEKKSEEIDEKEILNNLLNSTVNDLANDIFNSKVRDFCDDQKYEYGKTIPYVGWFWRNVDFARKEISIGDCGCFIGVMKSNKWDYPQRMMTEKECDIFIKLLEKVMTIKGKSDEERSTNKNNLFKEIWVWFQTLKL